ncbi:hypothetical protein V6N13_108727 [Hibiscus sabdariffa]
MVESIESISKPITVMPFYGAEGKTKEPMQIMPRITQSVKGTHATIIIKDKENSTSMLNGKSSGRGGPVRTIKDVNVDIIAQEVQANTNNDGLNCNVVEETFVLNQEVVLGSLVDAVLHARDGASMAH